jgi:GT2 family glycosyltransferase
MISPLAELRQKRLVRGVERGDPSTLRVVNEMTAREQWPDWVSGACLLVRRADAEAVGLLDERFFMYAEDVDFCAAIRARGRRICFTPAVEITHYRGHSAATAPASTHTAYRTSQMAFYRKHHPALAPFLRLYLRIADGFQS